MREAGTVSRVAGMGGQLGRGSSGRAPVNLEILSVGPQYRETAHRKHYRILIRPPFLSKSPI